MPEFTIQRPKVVKWSLIGFELTAMDLEAMFRISETSACGSVGRSEILKGQCRQGQHNGLPSHPSPKQKKRTGERE